MSLTWQHPLAETLLHFLWQGTLIALLVGGAFHLVSARAAEWRYGIGVLGLLAMAATPLVTFYLLLPIPNSAVASEDRAIVAAHPAQNGPLASYVSQAPAPVVAPSSVQTSGPEAYYPWIVGGWCAGVLLFGTRLLCGYIGLYRWSRPRAPIPPEIMEMVQRLTKALRMRTPRVFLSGRVPEALALGIFRPLILLPTAWLTELSLPMVEAVLAHELAHLRRHDLWFNLVQRFIETLLFYHPAVWWLSARLRQERELCCDGLAVRATGDRLTYARTLEQVARLAVSGTRSGWAVAIGGKRMNLLQRVQKVLGMAPVPPAPRPWLAGLLALVVPALLWWAMLAVSPTAAPAEEQVDQAMGTVVDEQGKPVGGVKIQVFQDREMIRELRADAQGQFKVPKSARANELDDLTLVVREKERFGWFSVSQHGDDAKKKPDFRMVMVPITRQVQGVLEDDNGNPLVDFPVGVESLSHKSNGWLYAPHTGDESFLPIAKTDAAGRFRIKLPATDYAGLRLLHLDRLALRLAVPKGKTDLGTINVGLAGRIEGHVTDAKTGKPLASALIGAQYLGKIVHHSGGWGDAKSNEDGFFVIGGLQPGQYNAMYSKDSKLVAPAKEGVLVEAGKTVTVDFQVSEGRRLAGKVIEVGTGKPLSQFHVGYYGADRPRSGAACRMVLTDDQGRFEFYVSPGPSYVYVAQGPQMGVVDSHRTVEVLPNKDVTDLILQATTKTEADFGIGGMAFAVSPEQAKKREENQDWRLRIRLRTADGRQVNGVTYRWIRGGRTLWGSGIFAGNKYDGDDWSEQFKGIHTLLIDADGFAPVLTKEFEFKKRMEPLVVDLQPEVYVPVRGRVVDADGKALAGARVRAGRIFAGQSMEFPWGLEVATDEEGKFELKRLRAGERLFLYADKKDVGGVESSRFLLEKKESFQIDDLRIPRGNLSLEGSVTDHKDEPVAGAMVRALDGFPRAEDQGVKNTTKTDARGRFQFHGLLPGKVWLQVDAPGYRMSMRSVFETAAGKKDVHVYLQRIPDPKKTYPSLKIELRPKGGGQGVHSEVWWLKAGKEVIFSTGWQENQNTIGFDDDSPLKPGEIYALAIAAEGYAWPKPVLVKAEKIDEPVVIDLEPAAPVALRGRVVDDKGQPLAGVKVGLSRTLLDKIVDEPWREISGGEQPKLPVTDAEGRFRMGDLLPGCEVAVYVNKPGYTGAMWARMTLAKGQDSTLPDISLHSSERRITGDVVNAEGKPVAGAKVTVHDFGDVSTTTMADGKFEIMHAPHGVINLIVDAADYPVAYERVMADENNLRVTLREEE